MKTHLAIFGVLAAIAACKTPASKTSGVSSTEGGPDDAAFFEAKATCQAKMGFRLQSDMSIQVVDSTSYADIVDLRAGDVVKTLNDEDVDSPSRFEELCLEIGAKRPALWRYGVERAATGEKLTLGGKASFECDYLTLVGCGPLPKRDERD